MSQFPKRWKNTLCYGCRYFLAYPTDNGSGEDWTWECEDEAEESDDGLVSSDETCNSFVASYDWDYDK